MSFPSRCAHDTTRSQTCYEKGLAAPVACPKGTLCIAPYAPAIAAAPGYIQSDSNASSSFLLVNNTTEIMIARSYNLSIAMNMSNNSNVMTNTTSSRVLVECPIGYYCNLGRSDSEAVADLLCPASTYCETPDIVEPIFCDQGGNCTTDSCEIISFCPSGSNVERMCPAGYYCTNPDGSDEHVIPCDLGSYCPNGSVIWSICAAGYYCPDPQHQLLCEEGGYCPEGSINVIPCGMFELCEAGSAAPQIYFSVIVLCGLPILVMTLCFGVQRCLLHCRNRRHAQRLASVIEKISMMQQRQNQESLHSSASTTVTANVQTMKVVSLSTTKTKEVNAQTIPITTAQKTPTNTAKTNRNTVKNTSEKHAPKTSLSTLSSPPNSIIESSIADNVELPIKHQDDTTVVDMMGKTDKLFTENKQTDALEDVAVNLDDIDASAIDFSLSGMSPFNMLAQQAHRTRAYSRQRLRSRSRTRSRSSSGSLGMPTDDESESTGGVGKYSNICDRALSQSVIEEVAEENDEDLELELEHSKNIDQENVGDEDEEDSLEHELGVFRRAGLTHKTLESTIDISVQNLYIYNQEKTNACICFEGLHKSSKKSQHHTVVPVAGRHGSSMGVTSLGSTRPRSVSHLQSDSKKYLLYGVTGKFSHGQLTAVMGPSGSGKTLLLQLLAGKIPPSVLKVGGTLMINGCPVPAKVGLSMLAGHTGYVPKDDTMMRTLTVKENLIFSARSRLAPKRNQTNKKTHIDLVNGVIDILGLYSIRHKVIGDEKTRGISGGQRKRVNIGIELVAEPTVLLLDEPTSGLDATCAAEVCSAMKALATLGLTVVSVIHQPRFEIYCNFDKLVLLESCGKCRYFNECAMATLYFERKYGWICPDFVNPADFLMDSLARIDAIRISGIGLEERRLQFKAENDSANDHSYFGSTGVNNLGVDSDSDIATLISFPGEVSGPSIELIEVNGSSSKTMNLQDKADKSGVFKAISVKSNKEQFPGKIISRHREQIHFDAERHNLTRDINSIQQQLPDTRPSASALLLLWLCFWRSMVQQTRSKAGWVIDNVLVLLCALFLGLLYMRVEGEECNDCEWMSPGQPGQAFSGCSDAVINKYQPLLVQIGDQVLLRGTMCMIAMGITSATSAMRVFQNERHEVVYKKLVS